MCLFFLLFSLFSSFYLNVPILTDELVRKPEVGEGVGTLGTQISVGPLGIWADLTSKCFMKNSTYKRLLDQILDSIIKAITECFVLPVTISFI